MEPILGGDSTVVVLSIVIIILLVAGTVGWSLYGTQQTQQTQQTPQIICNTVCGTGSYLNKDTCRCVCLPGFELNTSGLCVVKTCNTGYTWDPVSEMCTALPSNTDSTSEQTPEPTCPKGQNPIMKDGNIICASTNKGCNGYFINGQCIKKDCSNVKCLNGGSPDSDCVCKCPKGFAGRDCSLGCLDSSGNPNNRCYNGKYDSTTCRCNCDDGFGGTECNIYSGISTKKDCDNKDKGIWTGLECITKKGESPFPRAGLPRRLPSDFTCYESVADKYYYVHDKSSADPWQCYLGDNVHGIIGDDTSYLYGQRCIGGSKQECLDLITELV